MQQGHKLVPYCFIRNENENLMSRYSDRLTARSWVRFPEQLKFDETI